MEQCTAYVVQKLNSIKRDKTPTDSSLNSFMTDEFEMRIS